MNGEHKTGGEIAPAFVNGRQAAELLGVSERKLHDLRAQGLVPEPIVLGPRALRWEVSSLLAHVKATAKRGSQPEPAHLKARRESSKAESC